VNVGFTPRSRIAGQSNEGDNAGGASDQTKADCNDPGGGRCDQNASGEDNANAGGGPDEKWAKG